MFLSPTSKTETSGDAQHQGRLNQFCRVTVAKYPRRRSYFFFFFFSKAAIPPARASSCRPTEPSISGVDTETGKESPPPNEDSANAGKPRSAVITTIKILYRFSISLPSLVER